MTTKITQANTEFSTVTWQSVKTASFTAVAGEGYFIDSSSGAITVTLPASASLGDEVNVVVITAGNTITIGRNGHNIDGSASDQTLTTDGDSKRYVYVNSSEGWKTFQSTIAPSFISATGGTETTSGDYKIHTFTSSGCFTVASLSNASDNNKVSYMVVAGGGSGGGATPGTSSDYEGGGGGGGGYRESKSPVDDYTASPTAATGGLAVTAQTYPITVGGGGSSISCSNCRGNDGSNSVFSTITSTGGGGGGSRNSAVQPGLSGGSGGGGGQGDACSPAGYSVVSNIAQNFGSGNTPPVSPSQGNPGGGGTVGGSPASSGGGGGGGAGSAGTPGSYPSAVGGNGGDGVSSSITGSPLSRAGGGGGAGTNTSGGLPTTGPGGQGAAPGRAASNGYTNRGGGGGGSAGTRPEASGAGGSGIVVIRYKYQ